MNHRHLLALAALLALAPLLAACGDEATKDPAPICFEVDLEEECPKYGFPHVAHEWGYPEGPNRLVVTVDSTDAPPADERGEPELYESWCAEDPTNPRANESNTYGTPSPFGVSHRERNYRVTHPLDFDADPPVLEHIYCAAVGEPAYRRYVARGDDEQRTLWPENEPPPATTN